MLCVAVTMFGLAATEFAPLVKAVWNAVFAAVSQSKRLPGWFGER